MTEIHVEDSTGDVHRIDDDGQRLLTFLLSSQRPQPTSVIRQDIFPDRQPNSIHSRYKNHFCGSELGWMTRTRIDPDNPLSEWQYQLTEEGREWVLQRQDSLPDAVSRAEAMNQFDRILEEIDEWSSEVQSLGEEVERLQKEAHTKQSQFNQWKEKTQTVRDQVESKAESDRVQSMSESFARLQGRLADLEERMDQLESRVSDLKSSVEAVDADVDRNHRNTVQNHRELDRVENQLTMTMDALTDLSEAVPDFFLSEPFCQKVSVMDDG